MLDRVAIIAGTERMLEGERLLVQQAPGLSVDLLAKLISRVEAWLDPDGVEPREDEARAGRSFTMFERGGSLHFHGHIDVASGAALKTAIEAIVSAQFRARRDAEQVTGVDEDRRTVAQMQADALCMLADHVIGCHNDNVPLGGATVIVRVGLGDLESGAGTATIDGIAQPISITTARRLAADGAVIPWVCGGEGEILDWGREKRLFTPAQKLALVERDGGCAMCALPPSMTKAHHLRWWHRDTGPTDLDNGILLCETCHHRIHDNGWDIRIDGNGITAKVWFIPPPHVDPHRTPRLGGRARYGLAG
jgi:5-methylcytosine-specific restriction protein A